MCIEHFNHTPNWFSSLVHPFPSDDLSLFLIVSFQNSGLLLKGVTIGLLCKVHGLADNPAFRETRLLDDVTESLLNGDSVLTNNNNNKKLVCKMLFVVLFP